MTTKVCLKDDPSIGDELKSDIIQKLDSFHCFYHKEWWCHRMTYYHFRRCHGCPNGASLLVMAIGIIVSVFKNSIVITILSAVGTVIKGWNNFKKFSLKVDICQNLHSRPT